MLKYLKTLPEETRAGIIKLFRLGYLSAVTELLDRDAVEINEALDMHKYINLMEWDDLIQRIEEIENL